MINKFNPKISDVSWKLDNKLRVVNRVYHAPLWYILILERCLFCVPYILFDYSNQPQGLQIPKENCFCLLHWIFCLFFQWRIDHTRLNSISENIIHNPCIGASGFISHISMSCCAIFIRSIEIFAKDISSLGLCWLNQNNTSLYFDLHHRGQSLDIADGFRG